MDGTQYLCHRFGKSWKIFICSAKVDKSLSLTWEAQSPLENESEPPVTRWKFRGKLLLQAFWNYRWIFQGGSLQKTPYIFVQLGGSSSCDICCHSGVCEGVGHFEVRESGFEDCFWSGKVRLRFTRNILLQQQWLSDQCQFMLSSLT